MAASTSLRLLITLFWVSRGSIRTMTPEFYAVITSAVGLGTLILTIGVWILHGQRGMARDVVDLRERMARLEGLFESFTSPHPEGETPAPVEVVP